MAKISSWHFRQLFVVVWLKKACKMGGHGHPRPPLATPLKINDSSGRPSDAQQSIIKESMNE